MFEVIDRIFNPGKYPEVEQAQKKEPEPLQPMQIVKTVYPDGGPRGFYGLQPPAHG